MARKARVRRRADLGTCGTHRRTVFVTSIVATWRRERGLDRCVLQHAMSLSRQIKRRGRLGSVMALAGRCRFGEGNRMSSAGSAWATVLALALASGAISPPFCRTAPGMISSSPSATRLLRCSSVQPKNESLPPYRLAGLIVALPISILTNGTRSASRSPHRRRSALDSGSLAI